MKKFIIVTMLSYLSLFLSAQWSSDPAENSPISTAGGEQAIPKIATSDNGTTYISWFSNESGNYNVRLQKLDVFGNIQWDSAGLLVSDNPAMTWLTDWDMAIDQEEYAIICFQDIRNGDNDVFAYRISPEGEFVWGEDGIEMSTGPAFDASPKVIVTNAGNAIFAWQADSVVIIQKISAAGEKLWGENGITLSSSNTYSWPQLIPVGDDDVVLKYFEDSGPLWAPTRHVFTQRYDTDGNPVWSAPTVISDAGGISAWTQIFPFINDGSDGFYLAWHDDRDNNMLSGIFVQHVDSEGNVLYADDGIEASVMPGRNHFYARLALPPGSQEVFVFWNEMDSDQNNRGIYGQKISATGQRLWTDNGKSFIEISPVNVFPFAARNSDSDMIIMYEEYYDAINADIKAMRIDTDGNFMWENEKIDMCTVQSEKVHTEAGSYNNGQWISAWEDSRNGGKDIYAQNIQLDGSLGPIIIPANLTVTPDSVICDEIGPHFVYIANFTSEIVTVQDIYFELGWYTEFYNLPTLPYSLGVNDSIVVEFFVIPGSGSYDPDGYEYDVMAIESEIGDYFVDIAINWDLLGAVSENNQNKKVIKVMPNPAKHYITFTSESGQVLNYELFIFDSFGKKIKTFTPESNSKFIWDLKGDTGQKVPPGTYYYRLISKEHYESGEIILLD